MNVEPATQKGGTPLYGLFMSERGIAEYRNRVKKKLKLDKNKKEERNELKNSKKIFQ